MLILAHEGVFANEGKVLAWEESWPKREMLAQERGGRGHWPWRRRGVQNCGQISARTSAAWFQTICFTLMNPLCTTIKYPVSCC